MKLITVVGPEGTMVDAEVDAVAVCFEANAVDRALTGGVDGVVTIVTAVVTGEASAEVGGGVCAPGLGFVALDG